MDSIAGEKPAVAKTAAPPMATFVERICGLIARPRALSQSERSDVAMAFEDTMAVAYAGWHEPVAQACLKIYQGDGVALLDGSHASTTENAALIHATAAHALDYDDVHMTSVTHASAVLVPALLAMAAEDSARRSRLFEAYAVGLAVNIALGKALGFSHYERGWHATSTIGPLAAAAALAHLCGLDDAQSRAALALAAAQAGGLQRNFGSMGKPLQAGFAAAAAVRAVQLAAQNVSADADIFGDKGFLDLYSGGGAVEPVANIIPTIETNSLSRKLHPCCYAAHRFITAAFDLRAKFGGKMPANARVRGTAPSGMLQPLRVADPHSGAEAKFCGAYIIAAGLLQGTVGLADFDDATIDRPALRDLMARTELREQPAEPGALVGLDRGAVTLEIVVGGEVVASTRCAVYPGSPLAPASQAALSQKVADCLAHYNKHARVAVTPAAFAAWLRSQLAQH
jgi:2-methylcitrate dehydratase PrpD